MSEIRHIVFRQQSLIGRFSADDVVSALRRGTRASLEAPTLVGLSPSPTRPQINIGERS
jgi:hypothetical protein